MKKELDIVCGIIKKENSYLIARRGKGIHENVWEFPGGKVEENETREEAIVRELKEELNVDTEVIRYVTSVDDPLSDCILHVHTFLCRIVKGELMLSVHHEAKFVKAEELYEYGFREADRAILDLLQEYK